MRGIIIMRVQVKRTNPLAIDKFGESAWDDHFNISSPNNVIEYYQQCCKTNDISQYAIYIDGKLAYKQGAF
jgi:hypothetical protein